MVLQITCVFVALRLHVEGDGLITAVDFFLVVRGPDGKQNRTRVEPDSLGFGSHSDRGEALHAFSQLRAEPEPEQQPQLEFKSSCGAEIASNLLIIYPNADNIGLLVNLKIQVIPCTVEVLECSSLVLWFDVQFGTIGKPAANF